MAKFYRKDLIIIRGILYEASRDPRYRITKKQKDTYVNLGNIFNDILSDCAEGNLFSIVSSLRDDVG